MNKKIAILSIATLFAALSISTVIYAASVPDTGQTQSYTNTLGEDSDYNNQPALIHRPWQWYCAGQCTGLQWVKDGNLMATRDPGFDADITAGDGAVTWQHALDYVVKLNNENYLGHNDWRLPTIKELSTLVDSSIPVSRPGNKHNFFPGTAVLYWSSTTYAINTVNAWSMSFGETTGAAS